MERVHCIPGTNTFLKSILYIGIVVTFQSDRTRSQRIFFSVKDHRVNSNFFFFPVKDQRENSASSVGHSVFVPTAVLSWVSIKAAIDVIRVRGQKALKGQYLKKNKEFY